ncbi:hypothetical protein UlMin_007364, partial [Ulmus minor]
TNVEYGGIKGTGDQPQSQLNSSASDGQPQSSVPSNELVLPGTWKMMKESRNTLLHFTCVTLFLQLLLLMILEISLRK